MPLTTRSPARHDDRAEATGTLHRDRAGRRNTLAARAGMAMIACATLVAATLVLAAPAQAGKTTLHGAFVRPSYDTNAFADLTGDKLELVTGFLPETSWSQITDPYPMNWWRGHGYRMHWSIPMLPESGASIQKGATGAYNGYFVEVAQNLVDADQSNAIVRLGWEMNCSCQTWSAKKDPTSYVRYWRQVVEAMRSVKGEKFTFLWAPGSGNSLGTFDTDLAYPGDDYVDAIGASLYDHSENFDPSEYVARWGHFYDQDYGLKWMAEFGRQHDKPIALAEWGLSSLSSGWGGGDDPYFIEKVHEYVSENNVLFESYFNYDPSSDEKHRITGSTFPKARAEYAKLWKGGYVVAAAPPTTGRIATKSDVLQWTRTSDGSGASYAVSGAAIHDLVYVTAEVAASEARTVSFYLDTPTSGTPTHTESDAPFNLDGVSALSGRANPLDGSALAAGGHTLAIVITDWEGAKRTISTTFTAG